MTLDLVSFGRAVSSARKLKQLSQKELSALVRKEDGEPITPQYLNDIEHDRRSPSGDHLVKQFATVLDLDINVLFSTIGMLSEEDRRLVKRATPEKINEAFVAFRKELRK
jgi:transcriptional regulator with XRE-family HTH domain